MATDSYTQVAPNSTGDKIDESSYVNANGDTVKRQRITQGDPAFVGNLTKTTAEGDLYVGGPRLLEALTAILVELRVHTAYLQEIAGPRMKDDPDAMRAEAVLYIN